MDLLENLGRFYTDGGFFMHPIVVLGLVGLVVGIRHTLHVRNSLLVDPSGFGGLVTRLVRTGRLDRAKLLCEAGLNTPVAVVAGEGLEWIAANPNPALQAMDRAQYGERARMKRPVVLLGRLGQLAFYVGILGTIIGITKMYEYCCCPPDMGDQYRNASMSIALHTSAFGLIVTILCVGAAAGFRKLTDGYLAEAEAQLGKLRIALLWHSLQRRLVNPLPRRDDGPTIICDPKPD